MRKVLKYIQMLCCIIFISFIGISQSWATTIGFSPSSSSILVGDSIDVDIVISGLENIDVGAFDFDVSYDNSVLDFDSYTLGNGLGDIAADDASDWSSGDLGGGVINLTEFSWLWDLSFQSDSFTLATIFFTGLTEGNSSLLFSNVTLGNSMGDQITAGLVDGSIDVAAPIPEPATMIFFSIGLLGLTGAGRKKSQLK